MTNDKIALQALLEKTSDASMLRDLTTKSSQGHYFRRPRGAQGGHHQDPQRDVAALPSGAVEKAVAL